MPGLRSLDAKRPDCPFAGWEVVVMGVILTSEEGPFGVFGGMGRASFGQVRIAERWAGVSDFE